MFEEASPLLEMGTESMLAWMGSHWWLSGPSWHGWFPRLYALSGSPSWGEPSENPGVCAHPSHLPPSLHFPILCSTGIIRHNEAGTYAQESMQSPCSPQFSESSGSAVGWKTSPAWERGACSHDFVCLPRIGGAILHPWHHVPSILSHVPALVRWLCGKSSSQFLLFHVNMRRHPSSLFSHQNSETFSWTSLACHLTLLWLFQMRCCSGL